MLHRVKQFYWAIQSHFITIDEKYVDQFLTLEEKVLFKKLKVGDQQHSIRVCKNSIKILNQKQYKIDEKIVAKASLLHDIGKSEYSLNVIQKSIMVVLNKLTKSNIKKYDKIKSIDIYYNHGKKGAELLKSIGNYDEKILSVVKYHHTKNKIGNEILDIVRESDNKS